MKRLRVTPLLALCLLIAACNVVRNSPTVTPGTARDLNVAFQLTQANKDYTTFFTDVGIAQRQGVLRTPQVVALNKVGNVVKEALDNANATFKTYQATKGESDRVKVLGFLKQATDKIAELLTERNRMMSGGVA